MLTNWEKKRKKTEVVIEGRLSLAQITFNDCAAIKINPFRYTFSALI